MAVSAKKTAAKSQQRRDDTSAARSVNLKLTEYRVLKALDVPPGDAAASQVGTTYKGIEAACGYYNQLFVTLSPDGALVAGGLVRQHKTKAGEPKAFSITAKGRKLLAKAKP